MIDALVESVGLPALGDDTRVRELNDGGMGSLEFAPFGRSFGCSAAYCDFTDFDGIEVRASLYLDDDGAVFELDVWKVDFEELIEWPARDNLRNFVVERVRH